MYLLLVAPCLLFTLYCLLCTDFCDIDFAIAHARACAHCIPITARPRSAVGRAPDSQVRGPGFDTRSGYILSFLLPLFQEGQLSVTGERMCTKYWLTA